MTATIRAAAWDDLDTLTPTPTRGHVEHADALAAADLTHEARMLGAPLRSVTARACVGGAHLVAETDGPAAQVLANVIHGRERVDYAADRRVWDAAWRGRRVTIVGVGA